VSATPSIPVGDPTSLFLSGVSVEARSAELERAGWQASLQAALELFGARAVVSTAFGATGLCLIHAAQQIDPRVQVYTIDTGFLFEETKALAETWRVERALRLRTVLPVLSTDAQATEHGDRLWERDPDRCCAIRKKEPNARALADADLWITALRRDGSAARSATPMLQWATLPSGRRLLKLAPLVTWTSKDVWRYIHANALPYNPLHDRGYPSVGCTHCTSAVGAGEDERAGRWRGRTKTECGLHG
jgi:phosphoadenosine phosphosulfate reductase